MTWQPQAFLRAIRAEVKVLRATGHDFDLIDAHYAYPDGVAAAALGRELGKPVVVTARGSDLHQIADLPGPGKQIQASFPNIDRMITVSGALGDAAAALGYPRDRIAVLRNGVDTQIFRPVDGSRWRAKAKPGQTLIASVGLLIPRKGHDLLISALPDLPNVHLLFAGQGPDHQMLQTLANDLGVADRVELLGALPHEDLPSLYSAADMLVLASSREGWPNVLLKAMACGAPVVATNIGGIPEIITCPAAGLIVPERTPAALAEGIRRIIADPPDRAATRAHAHAEAHGWDEVIAVQVKLCQKVLSHPMKLAADGTFDRMSERVAVIGLGYVGLPVALAFAQAFPQTVGFDIDAARVTALARGEDWTGECTPATLAASSLRFTTTPDDLRQTTFYVVAMPTPIDTNKQPDLRAIESACTMVGKVLSPGDVVVFESTVYPGLTEEICGPILAETSGLIAGHDFHLGYSPERINLGDREHTIDRIVKVVSGDDAATLERVASVYSQIVPAGIHRAPSIKVAEAAKVIENTQRDLNIALMNELALIFDRLGIRTADVLAAAGTKWNFLPFTPGLVGGHCIGVDPYYLTARAEAAGHHPKVILSGRRINNAMGSYIAQRLVKLLAGQGHGAKGARVGVLGLTFKENVADMRNSRVPDIVAELQEFGAEVLIHDPLANTDAASTLLGLAPFPLSAFQALDGLVLAVPHAAYKALPLEQITAMLRPDAVLIDVKSMLDPADLPPSIAYWSL